MIRAIQASLFIVNDCRWTGKYMTEHVFESVKSLADELGISRTTLYKREKNNDSKLNGTYTEERIDKLKAVHLKMNSEHIIN